MFNQKEYDTIMTGDYTQLNWVNRFLRLSGIAATVKVNALCTDAQLIVDAKREKQARTLSREYFDSCKRQRLINLKIEEVEEMIEGTNADIIFCGHTHVPCGYQTNTKQTVVNVGSVGRPFSEEPKSCYAVLEIDEKGFSIKHNFVNYDYKKAAQILEQRGFEGAEKLAQMLIKATSRYPQ